MLLRLRVSVCVCLFIRVRVQGLADVSSTSAPGGNQVDGLPPAPVFSCSALSKNNIGAGAIPQDRQFGIDCLLCQLRIVRTACVGFCEEPRMC